MGNESLLAKLFELSGFLRLHEPLRITMYYSFFGLASALCGLDFVLKSIKSIKVTKVFISYILSMTLAYFICTELLNPAKTESDNSLSGIIPDGFLMDIGILVVLMLLIFLMDLMVWLQD